jgi:GIY-YIG catalytic domain
LKRATIYALVDPHTRHVRYVGRTRLTPAKRLEEHLALAGAGRQKPLYAWIRSLQDKPIIVILQEVEGVLGYRNSPQAVETKWIKRFRRTALNENQRANSPSTWDRLTNHGEIRS